MLQRPSNLRADANLPELGRSFLTARENSPSVRAKECGNNFVRSRKRAANRLARTRIPKVKRKVQTSCQQLTAFGTELDRFHRTRGRQREYLFSSGGCPRPRRWYRDGP